MREKTALEARLLTLEGRLTFLRSLPAPARRRVGRHEVPKETFVLAHYVERAGDTEM